MKLNTVLAITAMATVLSGCARASGSGTEHGAGSATTGTTKIVYAGTGVSTVPAPANAQAKVTVASALTKANDLGIRAAGEAPGQPSVALRLVTAVEFVGDRASPMAVKNRLAWVLTYHHSKAIYYGFPAGPRPSPGPNCDSTIIIDATTAATIENFQMCPPIPTS